MLELMGLRVRRRLGRQVLADVDGKARIPEGGPYGRSRSISSIACRQPMRPSLAVALLSGFSAL
jgi:hypothetical protein